MVIVNCPICQCGEFYSTEVETEDSTWVVNICSECGYEMRFNTTLASSSLSRVVSESNEEQTIIND